MDSSRMRMSQVVTGCADARGRWRDSGLFCREVEGRFGWIRQTMREDQTLDAVGDAGAQQSKQARGNASRVGRRGRKVNKKKRARRIKRKKEGI